MQLDSHTAMTKRFQTFKNTQKCDEKQAVCLAQALKNKSEEVGLLEAIKSEKEHLARHILLEKLFSNLEIQDSRRDGTSLFWATAKGLEDIVELLIWNGAKLTSRNKIGCTPLHAACDGNKLAIARILLKWGAPIDTLNKNGDSCLHMACNRGHADIVRLLLEKGTLSTSQRNHSGKTPVQVAEANEHWQIVNILKEHVKKEQCRSEPELDSSIAYRTRNRDMPRKRSSRDIDEQNFDILDRIKHPPKDRSSSNSPQRLVGVKAKRDSFKKKQRSADVMNQNKDMKLGGAMPRTRSRVSSQTTPETQVKTVAETPSRKGDKQHSKQVKPSTSASSRAQDTTDSLDYPDSIFKPYMNSITSSSKKRSMSVRLQSLPYGGFSDELNDLNKS